MMPSSLALRGAPEPRSCSSFPSLPPLASAPVPLLRRGSTRREAAASTACTSPARLPGGIVAPSVSSAGGLALHMPLWALRAAPLSAGPGSMRTNSWATTARSAGRPVSTSGRRSDAQQHAAQPFGPVRFEILLVKVRALGMSREPAAAAWLATLMQAPPPAVAGVAAAQADLSRVVLEALSEIAAGEPRREAPRPVQRELSRVDVASLLGL